MLPALIVMAAFLALGNIVFWRFDPRQPLLRRLLKGVVALAVTSVVSYYFGWTGFLIWLAILLLPLIYIHAIWLPRHGVNGWTAEPREKYHQLRGWPLRTARAPQSTFAFGAAFPCQEKQASCRHEGAKDF